LAICRENDDEPMDLGACLMSMAMGQTYDNIYIIFIYGHTWVMAIHPIMGILGYTVNPYY
jgi:hypothetical protein